MTPRPSHRELSNKIRHAAALLAADSVSILEPDVVLADAIELGYSFKHDFHLIVNELLTSATPEKYAGTRPPLKSYETSIKGADLYAFVINSVYLDNRAVYFKFALYNDILVIVSLHEDRKEETHGEFTK